MITAGLELRGRCACAKPRNAIYTRKHQSSKMIHYQKSNHAHRLCPSIISTCSSPSVATASHPSDEGDLPRTRCHNDMKNSRQIVSK